MSALQTTKRPVLAIMMLLGGAVCCSRPTSGPSAAPSSSSSASIRTPPDGPSKVEIHNLRRIENTRSCVTISPALLASPRVAIRRAAARALARCESPNAQAPLTTLLPDGDDETLAWTVFGLGTVNKRLAPGMLPRLAVRAASYRMDHPNDTVSRQPVDPWLAFALAVASARSVEAELTLAAWLDGPVARRRAAVVGLGALASHRHRLEEETAAALLRATLGTATAKGSSFPLYAFSRLSRPPPRVRDDLLDACRQRLRVSGPDRIMAVRAIGLMGDDAVPDLAKVLQDVNAFTSAERSEAARRLGKNRSKRARKALVKAIVSLAPASDPAALSGLVGPSMGPLLTALDSLERASGGHAVRSPTLAKLVALPLLDAMPPELTRRVISLRCRAAVLLVHRNVGDPRLFACDPDPHGVAGGVAKARVLNRAKIKGSRAATWRTLLADDQPAVVREAALRLIEHHPELQHVDSVIAKALQSAPLGVVTVAAQQVLANPSWFSSDDPKKKTATQKALLDVFNKKRPADAIETEGALARAVGAVGLNPAIGRLQKLCHGDNPTLRRDAQRGLDFLLEKKSSCVAPARRSIPAAVELSHLLASPIELTLQTPAGPLHLRLDPSVAPVAATRVLDLVRHGFYRGVVVHRVVPGFVVQFGDPDKDGFGGANLPPLQDELSPRTFGPLDVGVATAGADTGSSQIFVTLSRSPHLDGSYAWIGTAQGPWDTLVEGDEIRTMTVEKTHASDVSKPSSSHK